MASLLFFCKLLTVPWQGCFPSAAVFIASGANGAAIQTAVDQFRATLGANNGSGRTFLGLGAGAAMILIGRKRMQ